MKIQRMRENFQKTFFFLEIKRNRMRINKMSFFFVFSINSFAKLFCTLILNHKIRH